MASCPVWAVPGPLTSAASAFPLRLLREGARPWTEDPADADLIATANNTTHPYRGEHSCPASSSWQDFLGFECRGGGVGQAQVHLLGPVP